jgi:hypothetical protein
MVELEIHQKIPSYLQAVWSLEYGYYLTVEQNLVGVFKDALPQILWNNFMTGRT